MQLLRLAILQTHELALKHSKSVGGDYCFVIVLNPESEKSIQTPKNTE
ncbi:MAG: hypothetical protein ACE5HX_09070 [bacterium]